MTCSLLFVADPKTGKIEEVGEGVDYGVRRRTMSHSQSPSGGKEAHGDDEKFLKGVRICRTCRPILLYVLGPFIVSFLVLNTLSLLDSNSMCKKPARHLFFLNYTM